MFRNKVLREILKKGQEIGQLKVNPELHHSCPTDPVAKKKHLEMIATFLVGSWIAWGRSEYIGSSFMKPIEVVRNLHNNEKSGEVLKKIMKTPKWGSQESEYIWCDIRHHQMDKLIDPFFENLSDEEATRLIENHTMNLWNNPQVYLGLEKHCRRLHLRHPNHPISV
jgi:hypothetical protein